MNMLERLSNTACRLLGCDPGPAVPPPGWISVDVKTLRRVVGILGVGLPLVMAIWGFVILGGIELLPSISAYYDLRTRDGFVGILFVVGWFLLAYKGYEPTDDRAGDVACVCAVGTALFPHNGSGLQNEIHFAAAAGMFLTLAFFALCLFTKTGGDMTPEKKRRNVVYRVCGWAILVCVAVMGILAIPGVIDGSVKTESRIVFWLEAAALTAFGVSWFVKGETLFRDPR